MFSDEAFIIFGRRYGTMLDGLKRFLGVNEEDDGYYDDNEDMFPQRSAADDDGYQPEPTGKRNKVVNINATTQLQVVLVKPERFDDASTVADHQSHKKNRCAEVFPSSHNGFMLSGKVGATETGGRIIFTYTK